MVRKLLFVLFFTLAPTLAHAGEAGPVMRQWYKLVLELVRHTPTYSPPVASRSFAYLGVTGYEVVVSGKAGLTSLAGQLNGLTPLPKRPRMVYDEAVVMQAAMAASVRVFFGNTGPSGQQAMDRMEAALDAKVAEGVAPDVVQRSREYGQRIAQHILDWSASDGGAVVENMGFPREWVVSPEPGHWKPTSLVAQQQAPLLPGWGENRPFAMPAGSTCDLPPPPAYSEDPASEFMRNAQEVYDTSKSLTDEQKKIARFWSDDPMLSPTPPGHWLSIVLTLIDRDKLDTAHTADALMRIGVGVADAFIGCWWAKYEYDYVRPVTVIKKLIDPKWETLLITPPFPEYPSGHSTQSGAAAEVLTGVFGEDFAFDDPTHEDDGIPARHFPSFRAAAEEAAVSRLYGGIHFRPANENGLKQGECIGAYTVALRTLP